jgi:hypothetical protein
MDVATFIKNSGLSDHQLAARYGFDRSYWAHVRLGDRPLSKRMALAIWRRDQEKVGPLAGISDSDVAVLDRLAPVLL